MIKLTATILIAISFLTWAKAESHQSQLINTFARIDVMLHCASIHPGIIDDAKAGKVKKDYPLWLEKALPLFARYAETPKQIAENAAWKKLAELELDKMVESNILSERELTEKLELAKLKFSLDYIEEAKHWLQKKQTTKAGSS